jgi:uncharacterized phiE125 gp8 family phage protein
MSYRPRNRVFAPAALTTPCVDLSAMRDHLRYTGSEEDRTIQSLLRAAQLSVEKYTQRLLTRRAATLKLPGLPSGNCAVELPGGEVGSITSVTVDGSPLTGVQAFGDSPALALPDADWPAVAGTVYPVAIAYQVGFVAAPDDLQAAVKLIAAELFERRSNGNEGAISEVPISARCLMDPWRIRPL